MRILVALLAACIASVAFWSSLDRPLAAPDWKGQIRGLAYSPSGLYSESDKDHNVTDERIRRDLAQLSKMTRRIRTYTVDYNHHRIPYIAREYGMKVSLGIWLRGDKTYNEGEIARAIKVVADNPGTVDRVFVGNEAVGVRAELTAREVSNYIKRVKAAIGNPAVQVGTAEVWPTWLTETELADGADFVGIHLLPYWEGVSYDESMEYVTSSFDRIAKLYPGKKIVIGETGWPSDGRVKKGSVPSPAFEAAFLRKFFNLAERKNYDYYVMEAYDQPWKGSAGQEGAVGAFWGMLDAEGRAKFNLTGPLSSFADWKIFAAIAAGLTFLVGLAVLLLVPRLSVRGYFLLAGTIGVLVSGGLFIVEASSLRYVDAGTIGGMMVIVPAALFTAALLLTETAEWAMSLWRKQRNPGIRGDRPRQQHLGRFVVAARGQPLRITRRAVPFLPPRKRQGFQGRRPEQGAGADRSVGRVHRRHRQRLSSGAALAAQRHAGLRRSAGRHRASPAGLPRREGKPVQVVPVRGIHRLLPHRHGGAR